MATSNNANNNGLDNPRTMAPPDLDLLEQPSPASTYPAKMNNLIKPLGNEIKDAALNNPNQKLLQMTMTGTQSKVAAGGSSGGGVSVFNKLRILNDDDVKNKLMAAVT
jgi:hypothetical protein